MTACTKPGGFAVFTQQGQFTSLHLAGLLTIKVILHFLHIFMSKYVFQFVSLL